MVSSILQRSRRVSYFTIVRFLADSLIRLLTFAEGQGNAATYRKDGVHVNRTNLLDFYNHGASVFHCQKNVLIVQVAELSTYFVGLKNPVFESLASALKHLELTLHSDGSSNQSDMHDGALR